MNTNSSRPNIVLIVTDQQHLDTIGAGGNPYVNTPSMDRLFTRGVSFTRSYCANPVCGPARASMFSGRMPSDCGGVRNGDGLRPGIPNIGQWLREAGDYETVYAGKWHVPQVSTYDIDGFEVLNDGDGKQGDIGDKPVARSCESYLFNRASANPFFLVASFVQPHDICFWLRFNQKDGSWRRSESLLNEFPVLPQNFSFDPREPEPVRGLRKYYEPVLGGWSAEQWRFYLWSYYRHIEMVDGAVGLVLDALEATDALKDTVVILTSDHGEGCAEHQLVRKNSPYDAAVKVPFIVSDPAGYAGHVDSRTLVSAVDLFSTCCDYADVGVPAGVAGQSVRPQVTGSAPSSRDNVFIELQNDTGRVVCSSSHKYVVYRDEPVEMLFDLEHDPAELSNRAYDQECASVLDDHRRMLAEWEEGLDKAPNATWRIA